MEIQLTASSSDNMELSFSFRISDREDNTWNGHSSCSSESGKNSITRGKPKQGIVCVRARMFSQLPQSLPKYLYIMLI